MVIIERLAINPDLVINWVSTILRVALQGAFVFGLVWLIPRLFPKIKPNLRCWLWRIVYLKFIIAFLGFTPLQISWFKAPKIVLPFSLVQFLNSGAMTQWIPTTKTISQGAPATEAAFNPVLNLYYYNQCKFWFVLWVCGVGIFGVRLAFLWYRNWRLTRNLFPLRHQGLVKLYFELSAQLKISRAPRIFGSEIISSPSLHGLIRPKIILPAAFVKEYKPEEIKLMLAHELAHFKRGDLWWNWLPILAQSLFFFDPLVWLGEGEWKELPEICCDQLAIELTGARRVDYGKVLVKTTCRPAVCRPATRQPDKVKPTQLNPRSPSHPLFEFYEPESKTILKKRLLALNNQSRLGRKCLAVSILLLALFGLAALLPWKLTPMAGIEVVPPIRSNFVPTISINVESDNRFLTFSGEVSPDMVSIKYCEVVVDDYPIPLTANWYNSGGEYRFNYFRGYIRLEEDFNFKETHQIKVVAKTNVGDFQEQYIFMPQLEKLNSSGADSEG